jgi:hypothetical protein
MGKTYMATSIILAHNLAPTFRDPGMLSAVSRRNANVNHLTLELLQELRQLIDIVCQCLLNSKLPETIAKGQ